MNQESSQVGDEDEYDTDIDDSVVRKRKKKVAKKVFSDEFL